MHRYGRVVMAMLVSIGSLQADMFLKKADTVRSEPLKEGEKHQEKKVKTVQKHAASSEKEHVSCENLPVDEENRCLKKRVKLLETEVTALKKVKSSPAEPTIPLVVKKEHIRKIFKGRKFKIMAKAPKKLPTYYVAKLQSLDTLKAHLTVHGFTILAVTPILKGKTVVTVTYDTLKKTNTLLATLQILLNASGEIRVQNPSYFGAAYLQKNYRYGAFAGVLKALQAVLGEMYESEEKFDLSDLGNYQFMFGMPYLKDTITVAEGANLLQRVTGKDASKYVAYTLKLPNGDIIVGHKLKNSTNQFLKKIGVSRDANILPYESLIRGNKAVILDPKYYLALSLPQLKMSDFMKIADIPGEIEKDIKKAYH